MSRYPLGVLRHLFVPIAVLLAVIASAQNDENRPERIVNIFGSRSVIFLGSEDRRSGFGASVQFLKPEKRLAFRRYPAKLMAEFYALHTTGHVTNSNERGVTSTAGGFLLQARYEFPARNVRLFADLGFGVQAATRTTHDLDSRLNTTPTLGVGVIIGKARPIYVTLRLLHISNGGTNKPNRGQNQLQLLVGTRF